MSMTSTRLYSPSEAAALSGVAIKAVNNAIDKRIVRAVRMSPAKSGRATPRALSEGDLLRLKLWYEVGDILSQERRERLFAAIEERPSARHVKADNLLIIDVAEARKEIAARTRELTAAEAAIVRDKQVMGGEPVFKGTRIPVRLIAAMLDEGASEVEILDGYPALDSRALTLAKIWVAAHPRRGRPKSLKDKDFTPQSIKRISLGSVHTKVSA